MNRPMAALCAVCLLAGASLAAETRVRLLSGTEQDGVWGTREFQVRVAASGRIGAIKAGGVQLVKEALQLDPRPLATDSDATVRDCFKTDSPMTTRDERGSRVFEFRHTVAHPSIADGAPVCRIAQRVTITPNGEIRVVLDCEWPNTARWFLFRFLTTLDETACKGYMAVINDNAQAGKLEPGVEIQPNVSGSPIEQLSLDTPAGALHFTWQSDTPAIFSWKKAAHVIMTPRDVGRKKPTYKGRKDRVAFAILLPVSQQ